MEKRVNLRRNSTDRRSTQRASRAKGLCWLLRSHGSGAKCGGGDPDARRSMERSRHRRLAQPHALQDERWRDLDNGPRPRNARALGPPRRRPCRGRHDQPCKGRRAAQDLHRIRQASRRFGYPASDPDDARRHLARSQRCARNARCPGRGPRRGCPTSKNIRELSIR